MSDRQVALVTGTSGGIGLHTAVGLAAAGLRVVATMRDPGRADELRAAAGEAGVTLEVRALDVTDEAQATALVGELGRVDVLVNNAGRGSVATLEQLSTDDLRAQLEVNYVGVAVLTRLVLPGMRAAGRGRIVTVTSVGGAVGQPFADAYCGAKFAVEGLMQSLAPVVARFGIDVSIVEPGAVASEFVSNVAGDPAGRGPDDPYAELLAAYLRRAAGSFANAQPAPDAARTVVEAAVTATPRFRWQTSDGAQAFAGLSLADLDGSRVLGATTTWLA
ncbi:SDR family oxidoreductase [Actinoplanes sp. NPDC051494]|uniref:SDR family oxidoreductase n=1 Tax=Actinoplanes sp. NPDC051494 TaxID=3363907 RepID=UPI003796B868